jgi:hypothetical protein
MRLTTFVALIRRFGVTARRRSLIWSYQAAVAGRLALDAGAATCRFPLGSIIPGEVNGRSTDKGGERGVIRVMGLSGQKMLFRLTAFGFVLLWFFC